MPTSIGLLITQNLEDTLAGITEADGHAMTLTVGRADSIALVDTSCDLWLLVGNRGDSGTAPLLHDGHQQDYMIVLVPRNLPEDTPTDDHLAEVEAAVIKAIEADWTRGGRAYNQSIGETQAGVIDQMAVRIIPVSIIYHTLLGNPYSQ